MSGSRDRVSMDDLSDAEVALRITVASGAEEFEPLLRVADWLAAERERRQHRAAKRSLLSTHASAPVAAPCGS